MLRSQHLLLSQGYDMAVCVLLAGATKRMPKRLRRTLVVVSLVVGKSRRSDG